MIERFGAALAHWVRRQGVMISMVDGMNCTSLGDNR